MLWRTIMGIGIIYSTYTDPWYNKFKVIVSWHWPAHSKKKCFLFRPSFRCQIWSEMSKQNARYFSENIARNIGKFGYIYKIYKKVQNTDKVMTLRITHETLITLLNDMIKKLSLFVNWLRNLKIPLNCFWFGFEGKKKLYCTKTDHGVLAKQCMLWTRNSKWELEKVPILFDARNFLLKYRF